MSVSPNPFNYLSARSPFRNYRLNDCRKLRVSSKYVRDWLRRQPAAKEESLTDWLLYDVSRRIPRIVYWAFSRHEEARQTGADWEWWLLFADGAFAMRVQAKKLSTVRDNYPGIAHSNRHGMQIDALMVSSERNNCAPFYAFYAAEANHVKCARTILDEGVFMAAGQSVYDAFILPARRDVRCDDALSLALPLSCFACCPLTTQGDDRPDAPEPATVGPMTADGWRSFITRYFHTRKTANDRGSAAESQNDIAGFHTTVPLYVAAVLEHRKGLPDWYEHEFRDSIADTKALVVYDLRESPVRKRLRS